MKVTKTNVLILVIALFLLLFPFATPYLIPRAYDLVARIAIAFCCWFTLGCFITAVWYWRAILSSTKGVKTKVLILIVALFLLLFPLAAFAFPITPRSPGRSVIDPDSYSIFVVLNSSAVKDGLRASTESEEFKQYFIENLSAIDSEFPEVELTLEYWGSSIGTEIHVKWTFDIINKTMVDRTETIMDRIVEVFSNQWYTMKAEYSYAVGDIFGYNSAPTVALICWILLGVLIITTWPQKVTSEKSSTKNGAKRTEGKENIMEDKT